MDVHRNIWGLLVLKFFPKWTDCMQVMRVWEGRVDGGGGGEREE